MMHNPPKAILHSRIIHPNEINHPHAICPNEINRPTRNPPKRNRRGEHPRAILSSKTRRGGPVCPPERPRSGVSIPKYIYASRIMHEDLTMDAPLQGDTGGHTGAAPTHLHQTLWCAITPSHCTFDSPRQPHVVSITPPYCTFDSFKPRGVPLPHRGCTFDSAGLASATQPTLGNNANEKATPLGVVLFLIAYHYHTRRMNDLPHAN